MARKSHRVSGLLVLAAAVSTSALAAEEWDFSGSAAELGVGYVEDDAFRFGRYTGLDDDGAFVIGGANAAGWTDSGRRLEVEATNLGLDSRYLRLDYGKVGQYDLYLEYDQIPNNLFDTAQTPFDRSDRDDLTLPPDWIGGPTTGEMPLLDESLRSFDIETERRRTTAGARWHFAEPWTMDVKVRHETKKGTDIIGGAVGLGFGSVTSSILPKPIDYETDEVEVKLGYAKGRGNIELAYYYSGFRNRFDALGWENPFTLNSGAPRPDGSLALSPDNHFNRISLSGGYRFGETTRLSGALSWGRMTQDQGFEPVTVNPDITVDGLPRDSLGDADVADAFLRLTSRPADGWNLRATYRYHDRDDDFSSMTYDYVAMDSRPGGEVTTRPLRYSRHDFSAGADYRFNEIASLALDYGYEQKKRDYEDVEREKTEENALDAKLRLNVRDGLQFSLYGGLAARDGSDYEPEEEQNPLLRKYHYADRDQDKLGASLLWLARDDISVSASVDYLKDDYDNSDIGLTEAKHQVYSLDVSYVPADNLSLHAFLAYERIRSEQANSEDDGPATWFTELTDKVTTGGVGVDYTLPGDRWRLGLNYTQSNGTGETDVDATDATPYPDVSSKVHTVELSAVYRYSARLDLKFAWWYENYDSDDWALDGVDPDTLSSVLLTGEDSPDYDNNVLMLSAIYRW